MNIVYLAGFYCNREQGEYKVTKDKMEYKEEDYDTCIVDAYYFVSDVASTNCLAKYLDRELVITDRLKAFYSKDEALVDAWLNQQKEQVRALNK